MKNTNGFAFQLDKTLRKIKTIYENEFARLELDINIEQWVILQNIYNLEDAASQTELSQLNYRNRATTSRVINKLCEKNLVVKERFENDLKQFKLVLTESGQALVNKAMPSVKALRDVGHENINDVEFDLFLAVLGKIGENYDGFDVQNTR
jgi:DNA-binding MarR family transcriptional regulator